MSPLTEGWLGGIRRPPVDVQRDPVLWFSCDGAPGPSIRRSRGRRLAHAVRRALSRKAMSLGSSTLIPSARRAAA